MIEILLMMIDVMNLVEKKYVAMVLNKEMKNVTIMMLYNLVLNVLNNANY
jgi:hypothetical protein